MEWPMEMGGGVEEMDEKFSLVLATNHSFIVGAILFPLTAQFQFRGPIPPSNANFPQRVKIRRNNNSLLLPFLGWAETRGQ
jgi:hypothetical protein